MNKEIEIKDYCGTITWLCMDDEIEFEAQVYFHFEEEDKMVHFLMHVVSRCCRAPFPKFHVLMLPFHLSQGLRQF